MKCAAIDIGSNTILLLVAEISNGSFRTLYEEQRAPRLGQKVDASRNLHLDSVKRAIEDLKHYKKVLENDFPEVKKVVVTATSAVRDASNKNEFIDLVRQEAGFSMQVLSGMEEAEYTYQGALSVLKDTPDYFTVIDIGGGSTEISTGKNTKLISSHSFNVGSVRFTERFLKDDPPEEAQMTSCRKAIWNMLQEQVLPSDRESTLLGVAGTVTSLALIDLGLDVYKPDSINGMEMEMNRLKLWIQKISTNGSGWLLNEFPTVMEGRADVFLGGLLILEGFMEHTGFKKLRVSTGGIRHGAILHNIKRELN